MTSPIHRVNAHIYFKNPLEEEQLFEDVKKLYKDTGYISTEVIIKKFKVEFKLALDIMARVINED